MKEFHCTACGRTCVSPVRIDRCPACKRSGWHLAALVALVLLASCTNTTRLQTLGYTSATLTAATAQYTAANDATIQAGIVTTCKTEQLAPAACEAKVTAYRSVRTKLGADLPVALDALQAAYLLNDDPSLANAVKLAAVVATDLKQLGGK